jgi:LPPG:FO 2-phospho-L-lactate transferase
VNAGSVVALSGGIGGAKLALGLYRVLPPRTLRVIVNTGDDFDHLGLRICPDVDTTLYTLGNRENRETGWGRRDETWSFMSAITELGGPTWFKLGDRDLALHIERTRRLARGHSLTSIIDDVARSFGIEAQVIPMCDQPVRTRIHTNDGDLGFQDYFVRVRCKPQLHSLSFDGASAACPSFAAQQALTPPGELRAIIICPSNPYLSIDPILAVPGLKELMSAAGAPIIAVTPLIGGKAIKGPTAKIMSELGLERSPAAIAQHYGGLIDGFVLDCADAALEREIAVPCLLTDTLMRTLADRERLARATLDFASSMATKRARMLAASQA